jgi:hypothetical protein
VDIFTFRYGVNDGRIFIYMLGYLCIHRRGIKSGLGRSNSRRSNNSDWRNFVYIAQNVPLHRYVLKHFKGTKDEKYSKATAAGAGGDGRAGIGRLQ